MSLEPAESLETEHEDDVTERQRAKRSIPLWLAIVSMGIALVLATLILMRVAGPLYGLLFPYDIPVPAGAEEIEHAKPDKGAEYWIYRTTMSGNEVAAFYENEGGRCEYGPVSPEDASYPDGVSYGVANCAGKKENAGLGMSWEVIIAEGYPEDKGPTIFRVYKYSEID